MAFRNVDSWLKNLLKHHIWILGGLLALSIPILVIILQNQDPIQLNNGLGWDGRHYVKMTEQLLAGEPISYRPPWVNRFGSIWLASQRVLWFNTSIKSAYLWLNFSLGISIVVSLLSTCLNQKKGQIIILVVGCLWWAFHWLGPIRFSFFDPYNADTFAVLVLLWGVILTEDKKPTLIKQIIYVILIGIGCLFREFVIVLPVAGLLSYRIKSKSIALNSIGFVAGVIGLFSARLAVHNTFSDNSLWYHFKDVTFHLLEIRPLLFLLGAFLAFGPIILIAYLFRRQIWNTRYRIWLSILMLIIAYIGGTDTERYLFWMAPILIYWVSKSVTYPMIKAIPTLFWLLLLVTQTINSRIWWPIPEPKACTGFGFPLLTSFGGPNPFLQLFSHHGYQINYLYTIALFMEYGLLTIILLYLAGIKPKPLVINGIRII